MPVMTAIFIIVLARRGKPSICKNVSKKFHIFTARKRIPTVHKLSSRFYDSFVSDKKSFFTLELCHM